MHALVITHLSAYQHELNSTLPDTLLSQQLNSPPQQLTSFCDRPPPVGRALRPFSARRVYVCNVGVRQSRFPPRQSGEAAVPWL